MKKIIAGIVTVLMMVSMCITLTACSASYVGTYKFESMVIEITPGMSLNYTASDELFTEDTVVIKINKDKTFTLTMNINITVDTVIGPIPLEMNESEEGTWEERVDKLYLFDELGEFEVVTFEGDKLIIEAGSDGSPMTITLKKV